MLITFALLMPQITWAMWSDIATIVAAVGTLFAALFALGAIWQTRSLTKQKAQPYVAASLEPHQHVPWVMELVGLIPIEGVVAVWKSPALSSGLAIVDEVSEPTRGSHRGVRVIR